MRVKCPKCKRVYPIAQGSEVVCPCGNKFPVKGNEVKIPQVYADELELKIIEPPSRDDAFLNAAQELERLQHQVFASMGLTKPK
jgi:DNA-directed RNA polymerase subunit RPC12/RpoP